MLARSNLKLEQSMQIRSHCCAKQDNMLTLFLDTQRFTENHPGDDVVLYNVTPAGLRGFMHIAGPALSDGRKQTVIQAYLKMLCAGECFTNLACITSQAGATSGFGWAGLGCAEHCR